jgi:hypothetical protein
MAICSLTCRRLEAMCRTSGSGRQPEKSGVYSVPSFGGDAKLALANATGAQFSPDGQPVLYWTGETSWRAGDARMLVGAVDGGNPAEVEAISRDYLVLVPPVWAPNGDILFFGHRQGESEKPNEWWIASLSGKAPAHILIPGLAQGAGIGLETLGWGRRPNGGASLIYSVRQGNAWTLFRTGLSKTGEPVGTPEQLTSGTGNSTECFYVERWQARL